MEFECDREPLREALAVAGKVIGRSADWRALGQLLLELDGGQLKVTGTNREQRIEVRVDVKGKKDGKLCVPPRLTSDIIKLIETDPVKVKTDSNLIQISSGRSNFEVNGSDPADFPRVDQDDLGDPITVEPKDISTAFNQVVIAASTDDTRAVLTGVLLAPEADGVRLVATDSYRLCFRDLSGLSDLVGSEKVNIPATAIRELLRSLADADSVDIRVGKRVASFEVGNMTLTSRLIEGDFPDYRSFLNVEATGETKMDRRAAIAAIKRVRLLCMNMSAPIHLSITQDGIEFSAREQDVGESKDFLAAKHSGDDLVVAFNPTYLLDGLQSIEDDEVILQTRGATKHAFIVGPDTPNGVYLLMPVRVS